MREAVIDALIWWTGAAVWVLLAVAITLLIALLLGFLVHGMWINLLRFVRYSTARYWVERMEEEGLTIMATEYRRLVKQHKAWSLKRLKKVNQEFAQAERAARPQGEK